MTHRQRQGNAFGDTTQTKIFVGGLAWETQRETMRRYFEQFGEILEAVVITDKATGRSKGYGFVTFKDADSASRACEDPSPIIDGRRANCNLASLGARPSRPVSPREGGRYRTSPPGSVGAPPFHAPATGSSYPQQSHYAFHPAHSYQTASGFTGYSQEGMYPMAYGNPYGAQQMMVSQYYQGLGLVPNPALLPYYMPQTHSNMQYQQMIQYHQYMQRYQMPILSLPTISPGTGEMLMNAGGGGGAALSSPSQQQEGNDIAEGQNLFST